ncbi:MAG: ribonuclease HI family protein [bacterium]
MSKPVDGKEDLTYALKLMASGRRLEDVWSEAGFASRKQLADSLFALSDRLPVARPATGIKRVIAYSDGASIGNPGDAGCGAVLTDEGGDDLLEESRYIGRATNNVAEYEGAILALEKARELGASEVELRLDSELVAKQITGEYRVKNPALAKLHQRLKKIAQHFDKFDVTQVNRKYNKKADNLANLAIAAHKEDRSGAG